MKRTLLVSFFLLLIVLLPAILACTNERKPTKAVAEVLMLKADGAAEVPTPEELAPKEAPVSIDLSKDIVHSFTDKHCFSCHNDKKQKGKTRLDDADFSFSTHASVYHWQDILDTLNTGEMPPEDEKQPSKEELSEVIGEITSRLQVARNKLAAIGGVITMRHLNRREYSGRIRDLFHAELPTKALPLDQPEGLDTNGNQQFFTSNHYVMYYNTGKKVASHAINGLLAGVKVLFS